MQRGKEEKAQIMWSLEAKVPHILVCPRQFLWVYACYFDIITNSTIFHAQKCAEFDHKFYGHPINR